MMSWQSLLSAHRLGASARPELARSPYHKDHDRIVFSSAFRHLNRKTQVHPFARNDHVHTRLTHSLEVGCVGRTLGQLVGEQLEGRLPGHLNAVDIGAIIQSACLAHDIGNPPFGHAGEFAIREWFLHADRRALLARMTATEAHDLCNFEGNAQGLRLLTQTEHHPFQGGMRLTFATLGAYIKYPWPARVQTLSAHMPKFGCYQSELTIMRRIAAELGLIECDNDCWSRHPLAYLVEAADDLCYALIDLEDGIEMNILPYDLVEPLFITLLADQAIPPELSQADSTPRRKIAALRGAAFNVLVQAIAATFVQHEQTLLQGQLRGSLLQYAPAHLHAGIEAAKELARTRIFANPRKAQIELGAYATLGTLLDSFIEAALAELEDQAQTFRHRRLLDMLDAHLKTQVHTPYEACLRVLDYVTSLSDHNAMDLAQNLSGRIERAY